MAKRKTVTDEVITVNEAIKRSGITQKLVNDVFGVYEPTTTPEQDAAVKQQIKADGKAPDQTLAFEVHIDGKRVEAFETWTRAKRALAEAERAEQKASREYASWVNVADAYKLATGKNLARERNSRFECASRGHRPVDGQTLNGRCACGAFRGAFPEPS
jgi:hypothetical protein